MDGEKSSSSSEYGFQMLAGTDPACLVLLVVVVTRTLPVPSVLATVLAADGIALPGHGAERVIPCFNPHHRDDAAMAMRIDTVRGRYRCYGCGIRGNSWTYLMRIKGLPATGRQGVARGAGLA